MNPSKRIRLSHSTTTDPMLLVSRIWFLLYDASTALPYKGTKASSLSLPPGSVVAEFCKAVKAEHSGILTGIDASQLLVYKNKLSFDKRTVAAAAVEEGMEEPPLEEDSLLDGLGKTKKNEALVVVVPSLIQPFQTQPTALEDCPKELNMEPTITKEATDIHCLVHITSEDPFTKPTTFFATRTAIEITSKHNELEAKNRMKELMSYC